MKLDKPANGPLRMVTSTSLQFGGRPGPHITQRVTNAVDDKVFSLRQEWNNRVLDIAASRKGPTARSLDLAIRIAPPEYRLWLQERRQQISPVQAVSGSNQGYIDDEMGEDMGVIRALMGLLCYFDVYDALTLPVALG